MTDRYAVIGNPIAQSKSPVLHREFARQTAQDMEYGAILCELDRFTETVREFQLKQHGRGLNVTMPFKLEAFELADVLTERAQRAQAVNTLIFQADGSIHGDNTDGAGLVCDITHNLACSLRGKRVLLLGAGGAVRGTLLPLLKEQPVELLIANRTAERAQELADSFAGMVHQSSITLHGGGFEQITGCFDVVINGSSASMSDEVPPLPDQVWSADSLVYDMAYKKEPSAFLRAALAAGVRQCVDGLGMLVEQGAESFAVWRGVRPDTTLVLQQLRASL